ncbi:MAG: hypothetical protein Q9211_000740 [Gyalolechia sp. 1 TL-2023]
MSLNYQKQVNSTHQQEIRAHETSSSQLRQHAPHRLSTQEVIARYGGNNVTWQPLATAIQPQEQITERTSLANLVPRLFPGVAASPVDLTDDDNHPAQGLPCPSAAIPTPVSQRIGGNSQGKRKHDGCVSAEPRIGPSRPTKKPKMVEKASNAPAKKPAKVQEKKVGRAKRVSRRPPKKQRAMEFKILEKNHGDEFRELYGLPNEDGATIAAVRQASITHEAEQSNEVQATDVTKDSNEKVLPEDPQRRKAFIAEKLREKHDKEARMEMNREKARMEMNREEVWTEIFRKERAQVETNESEIDEDELIRLMEDDAAEEESEREKAEREKEKKEMEREAERQWERQKSRWAEESGESSEEE